MWPVFICISAGLLTESQSRHTVGAWMDSMGNHVLEAEPMHGREVPHQQDSIFLAYQDYWTG
jgi:hypothetical protein